MAGASYIGSATIGAVVPMALAASANLDAALGVSLPDITARLAGAIEAQARLTLTPPTIAGNLAIALDIVAALELSPPVIDVQLTLIAALVAELTATLGALTSAVSFNAALLAVLGGAGVHAYSYSGQAQGLTTAFAGVGANAPPGLAPTDPVGAVLLVTGASIGPLGQFFGVSF
jgi:hypothetical protein